MDAQSYAALIEAAASLHDPHDIPAGEYTRGQIELIMESVPSEIFMGDDDFHEVEEKRRKILLDIMCAARGIPGLLLWPWFSMEVLDHLHEGHGMDDAAILRSLIAAPPPLRFLPDMLRHVHQALHAASPASLTHQHVPETAEEIERWLA